MSVTCISAICLGRGNRVVVIGCVIGCAVVLKMRVMGVWGGSRRLLKARLSSALVNCGPYRSVGYYDVTDSELQSLQEVVSPSSLKTPDHTGRACGEVLHRTLVLRARGTHAARPRLTLLLLLLPPPRSSPPSRSSSPCSSSSSL
jgi:hypothetical protein